MRSSYEGAQAPRSEGWRGTAATALFAAALAYLPELLRPGYYFQDDMQTQYVPLFLELGRSWARGELALVTDLTWAGGALAAEYQHGSFSLVHGGLALLCHLLGLDAESVALAVTTSYVALTAAGAYRLALHYRVGGALALSVALVASLNGFSVYFSSWLPALAGFAWLPWVWWAAARTLAEQRHAPPCLALFSYCLLSAGWHFAALMMALSLLYLLCFEPGDRSRLAAGRSIALPVGVGALLSAPALACFLEYARSSPRQDLSPLSWVWTVPPTALTGLLLPRALSPWSPFGDAGPWPSVVMSGGALPLLILPAALWRSSPATRRRVAPVLGLAAVALLFAATPNLGAARWPFRWLPLFHLALALAAARSLATWVGANVSGRRLLLSPLVLALPALLLVLAWQPRAPELLVNALIVAVTAGALSAAEGSPRWLPSVLAWGVCANLVFTPLLGPPRDILPRWDTRRCFRSAPGRGLRHLALFGLPQILAGRSFPNGQELSPGSCLYPGNSALLSERPVASGYSLLFGSGVGQVLESGVHGEIGARQIVQGLQGWSEPGSLFDRWGIAALLVPKFWAKSRALEAQGWRLEATEEDVHLFVRPAAQRPVLHLVEAFYPVALARDVAAARQRLLERDGRQPVYVPDDAQPSIALHSAAPRATIEPLVVRPDKVTANVVVGAGARPALIRLLRPYLPGQRATLDGAPLRLGRADGAFVVAEVPASSRGVLSFDYQPLGVRWPGVVALLLGSVGLGWLTLLGGRRRSAAQREQKPS